MDTNVEELFAAFPVNDRFVLIEALQFRIAHSPSDVDAANAADLLARIAYPETAEASKAVRATRKADAAGSSIVDRIAEYSVRV